MNLPREKNKPTEVNPRVLVLFGKPKSGKTTIVAGLENALIVDTEPRGGTDYVECMSIKVKNIKDLTNCARLIQEAGKPYKYIVIDTATALEDISLELAATDYKVTPQGKNWGKKDAAGKIPAGETDVRTLPNGAGYLYLRQAFQKIITRFEGLADYLILLGHTKEKMINKEGKELSEQSLDLTGKLERIVSANADALGYVYREKNKTIINFNGGGDTIVEARPAHLRGKEIVIAESNELGEITTYWDKIFVPNS